MVWLALIGLCAAGCAGAVRSKPGIVLYQTQSFPAEGRIDTLVIYVTSSHVRVQHASGDALIDVEGDRLVLLDPSGHTYREVPLHEWETHIREAVEVAQERRKDVAGIGVPRYERTGRPVEVAGYRCERYVLYSRRELLPGEADNVEQQIWVTNELEMPEGAYEAYSRALNSIESIGFAGLAERPAGIVLRTETRVTPAGAISKATDEIERSSVFRLEIRNLGDSLFVLPAHFVPASSSGASRDTLPR